MPIFLCFAAESQSPSSSTSPSPTPSASECMPGCHFASLVPCAVTIATGDRIGSHCCPPIFPLRPQGWERKQNVGRAYPSISTCLLPSHHHHHSFPAHPAASPSTSPSAEASPSASQCMPVISGEQIKIGNVKLAFFVHGN